MASLAQTYVDPVGGSDTTGTGAIGAPFKSTQKALNTITRNATGGDQINIKAGGPDTLTAALSLTTYGTPTAAGPLVFRGYTSATNDGGIGDLNGGGSFSIYSAAAGFVFFRDLHLHNCGAAVILTLNVNTSKVEHCEIDTSTSVAVNGAAAALNCYVHNVAGSGQSAVSATTVKACRIDVSATSCRDAVNAAANGSCIENTIIVAGATNGVRIGGLNALVSHNSIYSSGGTGSGIWQSSSAQTVPDIIDNVIEGFSGVGGIGIEGTSGAPFASYGFNRVYNCTTAFSIPDDPAFNLGSNTVLTASPFTNPSGGDLSLNATAGGGAVVRASSYPGAYYGGTMTSYRDGGALQHADSGGGGSGGEIGLAAPMSIPIFYRRVREVKQRSGLVLPVIAAPAVPAQIDSIPTMPGRRRAPQAADSVATVPTSLTVPALVSPMAPAAPVRPPRAPAPSQGDGGLLAAAAAASPPLFASMSDGAPAAHRRTRRSAASLVSQELVVSAVAGQPLPIFPAPSMSDGGLPPASTARRRSAPPTSLAEVLFVPAPPPPGQRGTIIGSPIINSTFIIQAAPRWDR